MTPLEKAPLEEVLERLGDVKKVGDGYEALCPSHGDEKSRHLYVSEADDGRVLVHCFKGCTFREVFEALNLEPSDAFPKALKKGKRRREYQIRDHTGTLIASHHREDLPEGTKNVSWSRPDGSTGLGGLKTSSLPLWGAEAIGSVPEDVPIVLTEGEKAASALTYRFLPAVGTVTGASGTPNKESLAPLKGRLVVLWPDADDDGRAHMRRIGKQLRCLGCDVRWYEWREAPEKGDAADHPAILKGEGLADLKESLSSAPRFTAPHDPATDGASTFEYVLDEYVRLLELRMRQGGVTGIRTGLAKIDNGTHGLNKGYSYIIAARPNVGKSCLAGQIALQAALQDHRVLLQTPEMSAVQYLDRFACYVAGVDYFRTQEGRISEQEKGHLHAAAVKIAGLPLEIDEWGGQSVARIRQNIELHEPDLVVIDYLQYVLPEDVRASRNQQVGQVSRDLSRLKSEYNLPIVIAAQLNRATEHRQSSEPLLADLRDSGEIEQDADVVMMLHRPDMSDPSVEATDEEINIICRKNRMGQLWRVRAHFVPGQQWLSDSARGFMVGRDVS